MARSKSFLHVLVQAALVVINLILWPYGLRHAHPLEITPLLGLPIGLVVGLGLAGLYRMAFVEGGDAARERLKSNPAKCALTVAWGLLVAAAGCGSDNSTANSPAAAIGGPDGQEAQPGTESGDPVAGQGASNRLHPTVVFDTSLGSITVRLNGEKAPLTVDNFLSYVDKGHYDDTIFEQVVTEPGQVVLGGAFTAEGVEKTTETPVFNEAHNMLKNRRGTVAMARQDAVDSATVSSSSVPMVKL